jgi:thymidine phosphorylase
MHAKPGDTVQAGQPLLTLLTDTPEQFDRALAALEGGFDIAPAGSGEAASFSPRPLLIDRID